MFKSWFLGPLIISTSGIIGEYELWRLDECGLKSQFYPLLGVGAGTLEKIFTYWVSVSPYKIKITVDVQ